MNQKNTRKQYQVYEEIEELFNDCVANDLANENKDKLTYLADKFVKDGYGQNYGGYICYGCNNNITIPSQKWHLLTAYYKYKFKHNNSKEFLNDFSRIRCPQLMIWIAEIAGLDQDKLKEAINYLQDAEIRKYKTLKDKPINIGVRTYWEELNTVNTNISVFKSLLHFQEINNIIQMSQNWKEVQDSCKKI